MQNIKIGCSTVFILLLLGCDSNEQKLNDDDDSIFGKWKLVESYISVGGPQYWADVEDGIEFNFFVDGSFTSGSFFDCTNGNFEIESNELYLMYDCQKIKDKFQNSEGVISYDFSFENDFLLLTPTTLMCVEGCLYKYKRIPDQL